MYCIHQKNYTSGEMISVLYQSYQQYQNRTRTLETMLSSAKATINCPGDRHKPEVISYGLSIIISEFSRVVARRI